jgi:uncharacterized protein (DUF2384 family)
MKIDEEVGVTRIRDAALTLMQNDKEAAAVWLHTPLDILGGNSPSQ